MLCILSDNAPAFLFAALVLLVDTGVWALKREYADDKLVLSTAVSLQAFADFLVVTLMLAVAERLKAPESGLYAATYLYIAKRCLAAVDVRKAKQLSLWLGVSSVFSAIMIYKVLWVIWNFPVEQTLQVYSIKIVLVLAYFRIACWFVGMVLALAIELRRRLAEAAIQIRADYANYLEGKRES